MLDWGEVVKWVVAPVLAAVGTGVGGYFLAVAKTGSKLRALEAAVSALSLAQARLASAQDLAQASERLERDLRELRADVEELTALLDRVNDSSHDLASQATLAQYIQENNERWQQMNRLVGRIEGVLDSLERDPRPPRLRR